MDIEDFRDLKIRDLQDLASFLDISTRGRSKEEILNMIKSKNDVLDRDGINMNNIIFNDQELVLWIVPVVRNHRVSWELRLFLDGVRVKNVKIKTFGHIGLIFETDRGSIEWVDPPSEVISHYTQMVDQTNYRNGLE